jgi:hypothetical protein
MSNLLYSLSSFLISIFFILLGVVCLLIMGSPGIRADIIQFILEDSVMIALFGFFLTLIGLAIFVNIILNMKPRFYRLKCNKNPLFISEGVFQEYLNAYWKELFPAQNIASHVQLRKNKIQIHAELPYVPEDQQEKLLKRVENDLSSLFNRTFGYSKDYFLSISFESTPSANSTPKNK